MFKRNKLDNVNLSEGSGVVTESVVCDSVASEQQMNNVQRGTITTIAGGVHIEGNIDSDSEVNIFGTLQGNIQVSGNRVVVMKGGKVNGDIICQDLIVDGDVVGRCTGNLVEIGKNGCISGALCYQSLTVKKGGSFTGEATLLTEKT
ncbi:polymer-forming cytoskeletal protein [Escherichia coli]|uniref:bactofilin family protein n=1 Tax=Escherichia coli TaxID=562 RepID=UPI002878C25A|nr:polymer-forming cytoskeletal protein [Escherichia coli]MDS1618987.1 polymer-forming cytoskeletal protein [Escherichia coli]